MQHHSSLAHCPLKCIYELYMEILRWSPSYELIGEVLRNIAEELYPKMPPELFSYLKGIQEHLNSYCSMDYVITDCAQAKQFIFHFIDQNQTEHQF